MNNYQGTIQFKVISKSDQYLYSYSSDQGATFIPFTETAANLLLCFGYTGADVGVYAPVMVKLPKNMQILIG